VMLASRVRAVMVSPEARRSRQKIWVTFLTISSLCSSATRLPSTSSLPSSAKRWVWIRQYKRKSYVIHSTHSWV